MASVCTIASPEDGVGVDVGAGVGVGGPTVGVGVGVGVSVGVAVSVGVGVDVDVGGSAVGVCVGGATVGIGVRVGFGRRASELALPSESPLQPRALRSNATVRHVATAGRRSLMGSSLAGGR